MISAISHSITRLAAELRLAEMLVSTDFPFWAIDAYAPWAAYRGMNVTPAQQAQLKAEIITAMHGVSYPPRMSLRRAGVVNDLQQAARYPDLPLDQIRIPALVLHGTYDPLVPYAVGQFSANSIPGARLVTLEGGGHFADFTHPEQSRPALVEFLRAHASPGP